MRMNQGKKILLTMWTVCENFIFPIFALYYFYNRLALHFGWDEVEIFECILMYFFWNYISPFKKS